MHHLMIPHHHPHPTTSVTSECSTSRAPNSHATTEQLNLSKQRVVELLELIH
jgi:hypothetical protein